MWTFDQNPSCVLLSAASVKHSQHRDGFIYVSVVWWRPLLTASGRTGSVLVSTVRAEYLIKDLWDEQLNFDLLKCPDSCWKIHIISESDQKLKPLLFLWSQFEDRNIRNSHNTQFDSFHVLMTWNTTKASSVNNRNTHELWDTIQTSVNSLSGSSSWN